MSSSTQTASRSNIVAAVFIRFGAQRARWSVGCNSGTLARMPAESAGPVEPPVPRAHDTGSETSAPDLSAPHPPPAARPVTVAPDPTRYGDWERGGRCIDF
ncbi:MAG: DUF1674 domain-containing protein [Steroidobacteraceae bacterium]